MPREPDLFDDILAYKRATHPQLIRLTRALFTMPLGDLTRENKRVAQEFGAESPGAVFVRAVLMSRMVSDQLRRERAKAKS